MILRVVMSAGQCSRNLILFYRVAQQLNKYHDTVITLDISGREGVMNTVKDIMEAGGIYPKIVDPELRVSDDDIPQG